MEINILGINYKITEVDTVDKFAPKYGEISYTDAEIRLDKSLAPAVKQQTLIHEALHGILNGLGLEDINDDEQKVQSIATALHSLIFGNTGFMECLTSSSELEFGTKHYPPPSSPLLKNDHCEEL